MFKNNQYSNAEAVVIKLLKLLGKSIDSQEICGELEKHPDQNSLLAVSDILKWYKVENRAYSVSKDDLIKVPTPFIICVNKSNALAVVSEISDKTITFSDNHQNNVTERFSVFQENYQGAVLMPFESNNADHVGQKWFEKLIPHKKIISLIFLTIVILAIMWLNYSNTRLSDWRVSVLLLFKTCGLVIATLLLVQSIDQNNPLVQILCGNEGKTDCNAILTSKAAKVFDGLSWSEVGFFYFSGTWLLAIFGNTYPILLQTLAVLNILCLPYTVYSVYYQAGVAKKWCTLCLTIQALFWLEFIPANHYLLSSQLSLSPIETFNIRAIFILIICMGTPIALMLLIKPLLLKSQQLKALKPQIQKFKYNQQLFETALKEQPKYPLPDPVWSITLGNEEANTIVTIASNPYCPPCSTQHAVLDEWLAKLDNIQVRIVFTPPIDENDKKHLIICHLMALNTQVDKAKIKMALHDWYEQKQKNYEAWAKVYPVNLNELNSDVLKKQMQWCELAEIMGTPTILINGRRLPESYQLQDVKYMLQY